jgi:alanine racemase
MLTWIEVDLRAIKNNLKKIQRALPPKTKVAAVIKSNAYGHGLEEVARAAKMSGVRFFCVDNFDEAVRCKNSLKSRKSSILILGGIENGDLRSAIKNNFRIGVYDFSYARKLDKAARNVRSKAMIHIKIDTGMHRLGLNPDEAIAEIKRIKRLKNVEVEGLWSHFADSGNEGSSPYTAAQLDKFGQIIKKLEKEGIGMDLKHLCNSAGILTTPKAHFDIVRSGIMIYGIYPSFELKNKFAKKLALKPAMTFRSKIICLRDLKKGERIGYGLTHRTKKKSRIAVLAVGYKDGYGRSLSNKGEVLIGGVKCSVVGRICMRMTMVDVSKVKGAKLGMEAVLLGGNGRVRIEADEVAKKMGTIPYEVLARISESVPRVYKN